MDAEELQHKKELLAALKLRKHERDKQAATLGVSADPSVNIERRQLAQQIAQIEREIELAEAPAIDDDTDLWEALDELPENTRRRRPIRDNSYLSSDPRRRRPNTRVVRETVQEAPRRLYSPYERQRFRFDIRKLLLLIPLLAFVGFIVLLISDAMTAGPLYVNTSRGAILNSGDTWRHSGEELTLTNYVIQDNMIIIYWRIVNRGTGDWPLPVDVIKNISISDASDIKPKISVICQTPNCLSKTVLKSGESIEYSHQLNYGNSDAPRSLVVISGVTDQVKWSLSR